MSLPGIDRLIWEYSRLKARRNKKRFLREVIEGSPAYLDLKRPCGDIDLEAVTFCGVRDFPELVLSMLTFLAHVGSPRLWVVYDDGTLGPEQETILHTMAFPVSVIRWNASLPPRQDIEDPLQSYACSHPLGKKYFALSRHVGERTVLYADSDVLFYPQARMHLKAASRQKESLFLADIPGSAALDKNLPERLTNVEHPVNSGLLILQPGFQWSEGNDYITQKNGEWGYFTEQTAVHINMLANHALPLDPSLFIVSLRDQFDVNDAFNLHEIAARHYVNIVRDRVWSLGWKRHFAVPQ